MASRSLPSPLHAHRLEARLYDDRDPLMQEVANAGLGNPRASSSFMQAQAMGQPQEGYGGSSGPGPVAESSLRRDSRSAGGGSRGASSAGGVSRGSSRAGGLEEGSLYMDEEDEFAVPPPVVNPDDPNAVYS